MLTDVFQILFFLEHSTSENGSIYFRISILVRNLLYIGENVGRINLKVQFTVTKLLIALYVTPSTLHEDCSLVIRTIGTLVMNLTVALGKKSSTSCSFITVLVSRSLFLEFT